MWWCSDSWYLCLYYLKTGSKTFLSDASSQHFSIVAQWLSTYKEEIGLTMGSNLSQDDEDDDDEEEEIDDDEEERLKVDCGDEN